MFRIGDYVVHYKESVCEVAEIGKLSMSFSNKDKDYYTLKPIYNAGGTVYTPVDNEKKQIRAMITKDEAEALIREMPAIEVLTVSDEKRREQFYKQALLTNECKEWIAIIKTAYLRKKKRLDSGKKSINVDDKYLSIAEKFLYGELAAALGISREDVKTYILNELKE